MPSRYLALGVVSVISQILIVFIKGRVQYHMKDQQHLIAEVVSLWTSREFLSCTETTSKPTLFAMQQ